MQKSTVGGILSIVAGALGLVGGLLFLLFALFASSIFNGSTLNGTTTSDEQFVTFITVVYSVLAVIGLIAGVLGIVGGIFSIQRKRWGWALAGAIAGCFTFLPMGIGAVVLVAMARSEFVTITPANPPQAPLNMPA